MNYFINRKVWKKIFILQLMSLSLIWIFVISVAYWIIHLLLLSIKLNDAPGASIIISLVAIPVFLTLAVILTYVFIGLHKEDIQLINNKSQDEDESNT